MFRLCLHRCLKPYRLGCYIFSVMMEGLCCLFVTLLQTFPLLVPFAVLYGYFDGAYVTLIPVVTSDLVGSQHLSSALGVVYFLHGIPYLISPPTGGEEAPRQRLIAVTNSKSGVSEEKRPKMKFLYLHRWSGSSSFLVLFNHDPPISQFRVTEYVIQGQPLLTWVI